MDFILNEAIEENDKAKIVFSDESEEEFSENESNFINKDEGEEQQEEDASFYRSIDMGSFKFSNQTTNSYEVVDESQDEYYGEDDMPELYDPENREEVEFDLFDNSLSKSQTFKNSLLRFADMDNQFFYAVLFGVLHCKLNRQNVQLESAEKVLGTDFFIELKKIEKSTMLNHSIFVFFDRCKVINEVLSEYGFFLRFYEWRNKFRYQLKQKLKGKNQMKRELSACVIQKFNSYELLRNHLNSKERKDFIPVDVVYEPTLNDNKAIECFLHRKFI